MTTGHENNRTADVWTNTFTNEAFSHVSSNEWYGFDEEDYDARSQRLSVKAAFLAGEDEAIEPAISYPRLDSLQYDKIERTYQSLLVDAQAIEPAEVSDTLYEQSARKLAELYRHKEISRKLGWTANATLSRERAGNMTLELFGEPDANDFAHLLSSLRSRAETLAPTFTYAKELLALTGDIPPETERPSYELHDETLMTLRADIITIFPALEVALKTVPAQHATVADKREFMQRIATAVTSVDDSFVRVVPGNKAAETSAAKGEITIGEDRLSKLDSSQLQKTTIHEVIGHLHRALNAKKQPDPTMRDSQPGNLAFEEGFATALEQIVGGEKRIAGVQYYLSLGLQLGLDRSGEKRDFRETFEILWRRIAVEDSAQGKEVDINDARQKAYVQCMRTMRGGALDARDISYFEGSKLLYPWLNDLAGEPDGERLTKLRTILSGRFDATNTNQMQRYATAA